MVGSDVTALLPCLACWPLPTLLRTFCLGWCCAQSAAGSAVGTADHHGRACIAVWTAARQEAGCMLSCVKAAVRQHTNVLGPETHMLTCMAVSLIFIV